MDAASPTTFDDIDPLDAYMDSIADEATRQAPDEDTRLSTLLQQPPAPTSHPDVVESSPEQRAVARKVAASPFCNVLGGYGRRGSRDRWGAPTANGPGNGDRDSGGGGGGGDDDGEATEACLRMLLGQPAEFLR